jgi:hypothetical protein
MIAPAIAARNSADDDAAALGDDLPGLRSKHRGNARQRNRMSGAILFVLGELLPMVGNLLLQNVMVFANMMMARARLCLIARQNEHTTNRKHQHKAKFSHSRFSVDCFETGGAKQLIKTFLGRPSVQNRFSNKR